MTLVCTCMTLRKPSNSISATCRTKRSAWKVNKKLLMQNSKKLRNKSRTSKKRRWQNSTSCIWLLSWRSNRSKIWPQTATPSQSGSLKDKTSCLNVSETFLKAELTLATLRVRLIVSSLSRMRDVRLWPRRIGVDTSCHLLSISLCCSQGHSFWSSSTVSLSLTKKSKHTKRSSSRPNTTTKKKRRRSTSLRSSLRRRNASTMSVKC